MQTFKPLPKPVVLTAILVVALAATIFLAASRNDPFSGPPERIGTLAAGGVATEDVAGVRGTVGGGHASQGAAALRPIRPGAGAGSTGVVSEPGTRTGAWRLALGPQQIITGPSTKFPRAAPSPRAHAARALSVPRLGPIVVGIDGGYASWSDSETAQRVALGAAVTRHEWDPAEPVDEQDDVVLSAAGEIHTRIHALLGGNRLPAASSYRDWVVAFIGRYGLGGSFWAEHPELDASRFAIRTIELGNEPYFGEMSAELYANTVRPTLEEIHRLQLPVEVVLPSRVYGSDTSWMDTLYERIPDLNSLFHAFADHPYWYAHDPAEVSPAGPFGRIDVLRRRMNEKGASAKPIFITEYGESTASCGGECVSEAVQAEHLGKMLNAAITRTDWRVEMISVFQLLDRGTDSGDRELQFGLLRQDGTAKPAYSIVRGLMQG